jgi:uncharacterized membrane protein YraQ (UPF0718 family)
VDGAHPRPLIPRRAGEPYVLGGAFALLLGLVLAARSAGAGDVPEVETFVLIFVSIVVEALPFILLGALVSAAVAVYVPGGVFERIGRLPVGLQVPGAALGGLVFPVCECGSVPVARRLILRGVHPAAGIAFMLSAPVLNPIVLTSTWVAYSGRGTSLEMVLGRSGFGLALAVLVGISVGRLGAGELLRPRAAERGDGHAHAGRPAELVHHLAGDFLFMGKFIVLGAAVAAAMQTVVPQDVVNGIAGTPLFAAISLMGLAFMLSLCSEADAFVAVSLTAFSPGSQLAFLVFGPMVDAKLALLYGGTFRRQFTLRLLLVAIPFLLATALVFDGLVE